MRKLPYKYYTVREDITIEEFKEMFPEARTVPQIVVDGKHIGGYTELEHYIL
jgi:glutaredoxin